MNNVLQTNTSRSPEVNRYPFRESDENHKSKYIQNKEFLDYEEFLLGVDGRENRYRWSRLAEEVLKRSDRSADFIGHKIERIKPRGNSSSHRNIFDVISLSDILKPVSYVPSTEYFIHSTVSSNSQYDNILPRNQFQGKLSEKSYSKKVSHLMIPRKKKNTKFLANLNLALSRVNLLPHGALLESLSATNMKAENDFSSSETLDASVSEITKILVAHRNRSVVPAVKNESRLVSKYHLQDNLINTRNKRSAASGWKSKKHKRRVECWASNSIGATKQPCIFLVSKIGKQSWN